MPNGTIAFYHIEIQANNYNRPKILALNVNYCGNRTFYYVHALKLFIFCPYFDSIANFRVSILECELSATYKQDTTIETVSIT